MSDVYRYRGSWLPMMVMFLLFFVLFKTIGLWALFFLLWFVLPVSYLFTGSCQYEQTGDVIIVDKRKNGGRSKQGYRDTYDSDEARYIHSDDGDWMELT